LFQCGFTQCFLFYSFFFAFPLYRCCSASLLSFADACELVVVFWFLFFLPLSSVHPLLFSSSVAGTFQHFFIFLLSGLHNLFTYLDGAFPFGLSFFSLDVCYRLWFSTPGAVFGPSLSALSKACLIHLVSGFLGDRPFTGVY